MRQRSDAVLVGEVHVRAGLDEHGHDRLVARAAVRQQDGLQQRRPAELVHVVDIDVRLREEVADGLDVPAL